MNVLNLFSFLMGYPVWARITIGAAICLVICILVFVPHRLPGSTTEGKAGTNYIQTGANSTQINTTQSGTIINQPVINNIYSGQAVPVVPTKQRARRFFETVNPVILHAIDSGSSGIAVMVNQLNLQELQSLLSLPDCGKYFKAESTGSTIDGAHCRIGGHINDVKDVGHLLGFRFAFTTELRNAGSSSVK